MLFYTFPSLCFKVNYFVLLVIVMNIFLASDEGDLHAHAALILCGIMYLPTSLQHNRHKKTQKDLEVQHVFRSEHQKCQRTSLIQGTTAVFPFILRPHNCNQLEDDRHQSVSMSGYTPSVRACVFITLKVFVSAPHILGI